MSPEFKTFLDEQGYALVVEMPDGMWAGIKALMFHWTMHIGVLDDREGYEDRWCYADRDRALTGLLEWSGRGFEGEPGGWRRHPKTHRRRNDDGDLDSERIAP